MKYVVNFVVRLLFVVENNMCIKLLKNFPSDVYYVATLPFVTFDVVLVLSISSGKVTTQLRCAAKFLIDFSTNHSRSQ